MSGVYVRDLPLRRFTIDDLDALGPDWAAVELVDGLVLADRSTTSTEQAALDAIADLAGGGAMRSAIRSDGDRNRIRPGLLWRSAAGELAIDVTTDDRAAWRARSVAYASCGLVGWWLIDLGLRQIEVYSGPVAGGWRETRFARGQDWLTFPAGPSWPVAHVLAPS